MNVSPNVHNIPPSTGMDCAPSWNKTPACRWLSFQIDPPKSARATRSGTVAQPPSNSVRMKGANGFTGDSTKFFDLRWQSFQLNPFRGKVNSRHANNA